MDNCNYMIFSFCFLCYFLDYTKQMSFAVYNAYRPYKQKVIEDDKISATTNCSLKSFQSIAENIQPLYELPMRKKKSTIPKKKFSIKDFKLLKHLGRGRFGQVYSAVHFQTGFVCAIKIISKESLNGLTEEETRRNKIQMISQIKLQSFMNHPNVIKLYAVFDDGQKIYLVMQIATDGHLFQLLSFNQRMSEQTTSYIVRQILLGLNYMHENHIIHRDIKLQNIVLNYDTIKICDFGWSVYCPNDIRSTLCGTPIYFPPQLLKGKSYNDKMDTWAIGTLAHELLTGQNPFRIKKKSQIYKIVTDNFIMHQGSKSSRHFMSSTLQKNPDERENAKNLLTHPFIKKYQGLPFCEQICRLKTLKLQHKHSV